MDPVDEKEIQYYPWNDYSVDYSLLCNNIRNTIEQFDGPIIIHNGIGGGLGHKFISLATSITISLLMKRKLYCKILDRNELCVVYMFDTYWMSSNNCFRHMKFNNQSADYQSLPNYEICSQTHSCYNSVNNMKNVIFQDNRQFSILDPIQMNMSVINKINKLNIGYVFRSVDEYLTIIYRLLANPTNSLLKVVIEDISRLQSSYTAIHLRTGGKLANKKEQTCWVSEDELPKVTTYIKKTIIQEKLDTTVFLSTDSDIAEQYLKQNLPDINFIPRRSYQRFHSTTKNNYSSFEGAIYDYFIAAEAKQIFFSKGSGFSKIVLQLTKAKKKYSIPTKRRIIKI